MVLRSAIGAFATVAIIGAVAAALPERRAGPLVTDPKPVPFGNLTKPAFDPSKADASAQPRSSDADKASLLKLAAYPVPQSTVPATAEPVRQVSILAKDVRAEAKPTTPSLLAPAPIGGETPSAPPAAPSPETAEKPVLVAAVTPSVPPSPADPVSPTGIAAGKARVTSGGLININRASVEELDRIPGGGRIGRSIAHRRPYRSVDDLVRKRVLRESAYRRIRGYVSVD